MRLEAGDMSDQTSEPTTHRTATKQRNAIKRKRRMACHPSYFGPIELAALAAVEEIDKKPDGKPDEETDPRDSRQTRHQQDAEQRAENRDDRAEGDTESAMACR